MNVARGMEPVTGVAQRGFAAVRAGLEMAVMDIWAKTVCISVSKKERAKASLLKINVFQMYPTQVGDRICAHMLNANTNKCRVLSIYNNLVSISRE